MGSAKRVLVLGARGLLGASLVPHLQAAGHDVLRHARSGNADLCGDLADPADANSVLDGAAADVVVNLAAMTNVDECEKQPRLAYRENTRAVENISRWILESGGTATLLQLSTDQVYDGAGPHSEDDVSPSNFYAFSKFAGELAAAAAQATIVRTNFFGPSGSGSRPTISDWIISSARDGKPITIFSDVQFSPLSISTLVLMLERMVTEPRPGTYNVGSRDGMTKADFALTIAKELGLPTSGMTPGTSGSASLPAYRPTDMRMKCTRFETIFGVTLPTLREEISSLRSSRG